MKKIYRSKTAFTLVELLVVIGIIALLISILLPALSAARAQANNIKCLANIRQMVVAEKLFAIDHKGYIPTATTDDGTTNSIPRLLDTSRQIFIWRNNTATQQPYLADWVSSLFPYLGLHQTDADNFVNEVNNPTPGWVSPRVLLCPSDPTLDTPTPGYLLYTNVFPNTAAYPVSYGLNADIACLVDTGGTGRFDGGNGYGNSMNVAHGPSGQPLGAKIDRVAYSSETLLLADCGVRPVAIPHDGVPLDWQDIGYYTTNYDTGNCPAGSEYFLSGIAHCNTWLNDRIPCNISAALTGGNAHIVNERHKGHINIGFVDGHAASVGPGDFSKVRVSPYR